MKSLIRTISFLLLITVIACGCAVRNATGKSEGLPDPAGASADQELAGISTAEPTPAASPADAPPEEPTNDKPGEPAESSSTPGPEGAAVPSGTPGNENSKEPEPTEPPEQPEGNEPLAGRLICIDPGHQSVVKEGSVPIAPGETKMMPDYAIGTRGVSTGVYEYTVVHAVAKKLRLALEELGAEVVPTKESVETVISNVERARIANDVDADIFVRIHCDGSSNQDAKGISVLYPGDRYLSDKDMLDKSISLSESILEGAVNETGAKNRGLIKRDDLIGFNYCEVPCTLIEMGFMTNPEEDRLLNTDSYQEILVKGIAAGICDYFESLEP